MTGAWSDSRWVVRASRWAEAVNRPGVPLALLVVATAVQLVPPVVLQVVPTQDGAAHVYSSWILLHHDDLGVVGAQLREHYALDLRPVPNMVGTALLVPLVALLGADVAERVLIGCFAVALVGTTVWVLRGIDRRATALAMIAVPFAGSHLVAMGFYNFAWGVVGFLAVLGLVIRSRAGWSRFGPLALTVLLTVTWAAHLLPFALAAAAVLAVGVARTVASAPPERRATARRQLVPAFASLLPAAVLTVLYLSSARAPIGGPADWPTLLRPLTLLVGWRPFAAGGYPDWPAALAVAVGLLVVVAARARRPAGRGEVGADPTDRVLAALSVAVVVGYCVTPAELGEGFGFLDQRMAWFPPLLAALWVASRMPPARVVGTGVVVVLVASCAAVVLRLPGQFDAVARTDQLLAVADVLPPGSTFVVLQYADFGPYGGPDPLRHESGRIALRAGAVDVGHYEAARPYFQVTFTGGPDLRSRLDPGLTGLEARPPAVDLPAVRGDLDYVVVLGWEQATEDVRSAPASQAVRAELAAHYRPVPVAGSQGLLSVWQAVEGPTDLTSAEPVRRSPT